jgi:glycosyltransferase involved in cell wall biosynthesis
MKDSYKRYLNTKNQTSYEIHSKIIPNFVYFGRLTYEKGFDRVILFAQYLLDNPGLATLEICGEGNMLDPLLSACMGKIGFINVWWVLNESPSIVIYHGRVWKNDLDDILKRSHYSIMPSRFLETFWLSALESIEKWVPVIGSTKWGLSQFLLSHHGVEDYMRDDHTTRSYLKKFDEIARSFSFEYWKSESSAASDISRRYTMDVWMESMRSILGGLNTRKILLISDFSAPIGWIESHIYAIQTLLIDMWYECRILTSHAGDTSFSRIASFILAFCNVFFAWKLKKTLVNFAPDLVWLHSVNRAIWPVWLSPLKQLHVPMVVTYHDLGFTTPFPSKIFHESHIPEFTLHDFFAEWKKHGGIMLWIASSIKYFLLTLQKPYFRKGAVHFVPSEFLVKYVKYQFWDHSSVVILPHCTGSIK